MATLLRGQGLVYLELLDVGTQKQREISLYTQFKAKYIYNY